MESGTMNTNSESHHQVLRGVLERVIEGSRSDWALIRRSDVALLRRWVQQGEKPCK